MAWRFGTSGIRARMGAGQDQLNPASIRRISLGVKAALCQTYPQGGRVVVCYDNRAQSADFARIASQTLSGQGFSVYLAPEPAPTPFLSFAVRRLQAVAGLIITASHNPPADNGYKLYGAEGAQSRDDFNRLVEAAIPLAAAPWPEPGEAPAYESIPKEVTHAYLALLRDLAGFDPASGRLPRAVFTPLAGAAGPLMRRLADLAQLPLAFVAEEMAPQADFAGIPQPAPDQPGVFRRALALGREIRAELLLATDGDGDRCGAMVRQDGGYTLLSGDETGLLLLNYLIAKALAGPGLPQGGQVYQSLISTPLAEALAAAHGLETVQLPVGFRHIAQSLEENPDRFFFGFEESGGYLATAALRDKDGLAAACLLLAAAAFYRSRGQSLPQVLAQIQARYGPCQGLTKTLFAGPAAVSQAMARLRAQPPPALAGLPIISRIDHGQLRGRACCDLLRYDFPQGRRLYIRPSGTESGLKAYIFAEDKAACSRLWQGAEALLNQELGRA